MNNQNDKTADLITEVIETRDLNRLYQLEIECTQDMSILHHRKNMAETTMEESVTMGEIKLMQSIINTIQNKIPDLKQELAEERDTNASLNHKFRLAAKNILKPETYKAIMDVSHGTAKGIRAGKDELRANKME